MRTFERFLARFGLVELDAPDPRAPHIAAIRKTDLFDRFIAFDEALDTALPAVSRAAPGEAAGREPGECQPRGEFTEVYQFKITLKHVKPPVWRRIQVPSHYSFWDLHVAIAGAMGWADCHLHMFRMRHPGARVPVYITTPDEEFSPSDPTFEEVRERISDWFSPDNPAATYEYDFGDGWEHTVRLEKILPRTEGVVYPALITGKRACPPEDVGGPPGYERFLRILKDPSHGEHKMMAEWCGGSFDPEHFDPEDVNFEDPDERWERAHADLP